MWHGAGTAQEPAIGTAGDLGGDAALARARVLRPAAGRAAQHRVRRLRRRPVRALLRGAARPALAAARAVLPHAAYVDGLLVSIVSERERRASRASPSRSCRRVAC